MASPRPSSTSQDVLGASSTPPTASSVTPGPSRLLADQLSPPPGGSLAGAGTEDSEHAAPFGRGHKGNAKRYRFAWAGQPEIIRADQKDQYYLTLLREQVEDVLRAIMGTRWLQTRAREIDLLSHLSYFALTTLLGMQTLGEEYVSVMQWADRKGKLPGRKRRAMLVTLQILAPYSLARLYTHIRTSLQRSSQDAVIQAQESRRTGTVLFDPSPSPSSSQATLQRQPWKAAKARLASALPPLSDLLSPTGPIALLSAAHLALFYIRGRYHDLSHRFAGVRYITTARRPRGEAGKGEERGGEYAVLGWLLGAQLVVTVGRSLMRMRRERKEKKNAVEAAEEALLRGAGEIPQGEAESSGHKGEKDKEDDQSAIFLDDVKWTHATSPPTSLSTPPQPASLPCPSSTIPLAYPPLTSPAEATIRDQTLRCTLCLSERVPQDGASAVTECGHVFDWECIVGWGRGKAECPLCRQALNLSRIVPVYNF